MTGAGAIGIGWGLAGYVGLLGKQEQDQSARGSLHWVVLRHLATFVATAAVFAVLGALLTTVPLLGGWVGVVGEYAVFPYIFAPVLLIYYAESAIPTLLLIWLLAWAYWHAPRSRFRWLLLVFLSLLLLLVGLFAVIRFLVALALLATLKLLVKGYHRGSWYGLLGFGNLLLLVYGFLFSISLIHYGGAWFVMHL
jgi:hypothetical protein